MYYITFLKVGPTNCIAVRPCKPKFLFWTLLKMCPHRGLGSLCSPIWRLMTWFSSAWPNLKQCPSLQPRSLLCLYFFCTLFIDWNFFIIIPSMGKFSQGRMLRSQSAFLHMTEFLIYVQSVCLWQVVCSISISKYIKKHYCKAI